MLIKNKRKKTLITLFSQNILIKHIVQEICKLRYLFNVKSDVDVLFFFKDFDSCFTTSVVVLV